ncbi:MAG: DUF885 family protein [Sphingomicrobium sp.]
MNVGVNRRFDEGRIAVPQITATLRIMSIILSRLALSASLAALTPPLAAQVAPASSSPATTMAMPGDATLKALYDGYATWTAKEYGAIWGEDGDAEQAGYLPRADAANELRRVAHRADLLKQLNEIPAESLSPPERINAAVLRTDLENQVASAKFRTWEMPVNSDSNFWTYLSENGRLDSAKAYDRYIARMRDLPRFFDEEITEMRKGLKRGFTPPQVTLRGREASIVNFTVAPEKNAYFKAFETMPATMSANEKARLRAEGKAAIEQAVIPAYAKLLTFWTGEYVPGARKTLAARDLPDGDAFYRAQVREYVTLDTSPEEIHQIGLSEVARINAAMEKVKTEAGFAGTMADFLKFLKSDPQFIAKTPDELMGVSAYVAKRVDGKLGDYFETLPRRRFTIIPVPDALAPFYTAGRGGLSSCQMNTYNLPSRQLYNIPALTMHECAPGHSFQAALAEEGQSLPRFRQRLYFSGYGEGWGLYTEYLGNEMGIYRTPYEKFGQLSYEMWRAARLVIDTGVHRYGWSRQQAVDYLSSHTALSAHEVGTEVDRYISWPGQALSYKLGLMTILRLRAEAEKELGSKFNIKKFHSTILGLGAVPLPVLENEVRRFIADSR